MKRLLTLLCAMALLGCPVKGSRADGGAVDIDECPGLPAMSASSIPSKLRVNGASTIVGAGGSGRYTYTLTTNSSGGTLSGDRYVAGLTPGVDTLTVLDDCDNAATVDIDVLAAFDVKPSRATIKPGTALFIAVQGTVGAPTFTTAGSLPSGGSVSATGEYVAGPTAATDLITVQDSVTGDQALLQYTVSLTAQFRPASPKLALPTGGVVPLDFLEGSGVVTWKVASGPGTVTGAVYTAPETGGGDAIIEGHDEFIDETVQVKVRILTELTRPTRAQGRRGDFATAVTGDFDGDGLTDLAIGSQESDLARPQGGAVFIFRGSTTGLAATPTWVILPNTDTAGLGAIMAAGDLDGDGKDDLAISEPGADVTTGDSGAVLLYRITAQGPQLIRPVLTGLGAGRFGTGLAIADVDGDKDNDLIVGSPTADIAAGTFNTRGVVDIFILQKDSPISDTANIRIGGIDLAADGSLRPFTGLRSARALVVADLNDDGLTDLASMTSVNNSLLGTTALARNQIAVQVHFGRAASKHFNDTPDLFVLPGNTADANEGNWRIGLAPKTASSPPMLVAIADATDSPNLMATGGTTGGTNAGGALFFDLTSQKPTGESAAKPPQLGPTNAFAKIYGDSANINAGRSFAIADLDADGKLELVLGAPSAGITQMVNGMNVTTPLVGKLLVYPLGTLANGAIINKPTVTRAGLTRADTLGTALTYWQIAPTQGALVAVCGRATTALGDFTGRIDAFSGTGELSTWAVASASIPNKAASQLIGGAVDVAPMGGALRMVVGAPGFSGPAPDHSGNDVDAGQALLFEIATPGAPRVLAEGSSNGTYARDGGWTAFGGRGVGVDVAMTDFDGDGRPDIVIAAPNFTPPTRAADGGVSSTDYATTRAQCLTTAAQTPGGAFVHLARSDGTYAEAFRLWAMRDVIAADGGVAYQRTQLGRGGLVGGFDFNGDLKQDIAILRSNGGVEILPGRVPDDASFTKVSMGCESLFSLPPLGTNQYSTAPAALGDLTGDGCDEVSFRYTDNNARSGVIIVFGFGSACSQTTASWVRISGDAETGLNNIRLGTSQTRAGQILANDTRDFLAVTADLYSYMGVSQPTVLLFDIAEIVAKRPASGERLVSALGDGLTPVPTVYFERAPGFGRMLSSGDVTGDGKRDLVVASPGANVNGDGTGAVFVFGAGTMKIGPNTPVMTIVSDQHERAAFGQDLAVSAKSGTVPGAIVIGAPQSYRNGTANGTAYVLPLDF